MFTLLSGLFSLAVSFTIAVMSNLFVECVVDSFKVGL